MATTATVSTASTGTVLSATSSSLTLAVVSGGIAGLGDYWTPKVYGTRGGKHEKGGEMMKMKEGPKLTGMYMAAGSLLNSYIGISSRSPINPGLAGAGAFAGTPQLNSTDRTFGDGVGFAVVSLASKKQRKFSRALINVGLGFVDSLIAQWAIKMTGYTLTTPTAATPQSKMKASNYDAKQGARSRVTARGGIVEYQTQGVTNTPGFPSTAGASANP